MAKGKARSTGESPVSEKKVNEKKHVFKYTGSTILSFIFNGIRYQLKPLEVYGSLPLEAPQVRRLIEEGRLKEV